MVDPSANKSAPMGRWILEQVAALLDVAPERINPDLRLRDQGLDSILALALLAKLEAQVGHSLPKTLPWRYPTVNAIARFLEGGSGSLASLAAGVLAGQLGVLVGIIVPLAALLVARDLSGSASPRAAEESSGE